MKRNSSLFIVFLMLGLSSSLSAQTFSINSLVGKTWRAVSGYNGSDIVDYSIYFYNTYAHFTIKHKKDSQSSYVVEEDYYLSDMKVKSFDRTKVGKNKNGKYIIVGEPGKSNKIEHIWTIESLTSNKLVLKPGGIDNLTITFVSD
jgi:hypothetical protein